MLWGAEQAHRAQQLIEEALGDRCPCVRGMSCPLLPARVAVAVAVEERTTPTGRFIARAGQLTEFEVLALSLVLDGLRERTIIEIGGA